MAEEVNIDLATRSLKQTKDFFEWLGTLKN